MRFTQIVIVALLSATTGLARPQPQQAPAPVRKFLHMPMPPSPPGVDGPKDVKGFIARAATGANCLKKRHLVLKIPDTPAQHVEMLQGLWAGCKKDVDPHNVYTHKTEFTPEALQPFLHREQLTPLPAQWTAENLAQWLTDIHMECAKTFDPDHLTPPPQYSPEILRTSRFDGRAASRLFRHLPAWRVGTEKTLLKMEEELKFAGQHF
ncbi:MAG: hypothetical protein M1826_007416 [Phylliscum demangeonii]|nr:MAG: hypothetical protein M1826_007416 [Phylliscum demangeonii]